MLRNLLTIKNLSAEALHDLWVAREKLSERGGDRRSDQRNFSSTENWTSYCDKIGRSRQVVNRWLAEVYDAAQDESGGNGFVKSVDEPTTTKQHIQRELGWYGLKITRELVGGQPVCLLGRVSL